MTPLVKNGLILIALIIVGGLGYYLFVLQSNTTTSLESQGGIGQAQLQSERFVRELNNIKTIELSDTILSDERFRSLTEFTQPVIPQPVGRNNPFAPVE